MLGLRGLFSFLIWGLLTYLLTPAVVIYDTDGREGRFEYRIRIACRKAGVRYEVFRKRAVEIST